MTTLTMPDTTFRAVRFGLKTNTQTFRSPLNGAVQTLELPGARWFGTFDINPRTRAQAAAWQAFLVNLSGSAGRFSAFDPSATSPQGAYDSSLDNPLVNGASQTGTSLVTDGWRANITGILKAGDYFSVNGEFKMVVADVDTDASGAATITFRPALRSSPPDNAALTLINPTVTMMLVDDDQAVWDSSLPNVIEGISFSGIEAF